MIRLPPNPSSLHRYDGKTQAANDIVIKAIVDYVCEFYGADVEGVLSRSRLPRFIWPRHVSMAVAAAHGFTTATIAAAFGRERTIVSYARKTILDQCDVYPRVAKEIRKIAKHIKENIINNEL
jgi:chromosomal replication initiation ATPase DnaA